MDIREIPIKTHYGPMDGFLEPLSAFKRTNLDNTLIDMSSYVRQSMHIKNTDLVPMSVKNLTPNE